MGKASKIIAGHKGAYSKLKGKHEATKEVADLRAQHLKELGEKVPSPRLIPTEEWAFITVFKRVPEGHIAWVDELRSANTLGGTLEEARENLQGAIRLVFEANNNRPAKPQGKLESAH